MRFVRKPLVTLLSVLILSVRILPQTCQASEVNPLNTAPELHMDVSQVGQKRDTFSLGQRHLWILRGSIPLEIAQAQKYTVTQTLDPSLTYEPGSLEVSVCFENGGNKILNMEVDYTFTAGAVKEVALTADRISISLTPEGMAQAEGAAELQFRYYARINENASMGAQILAQAQLNYADPAGQPFVEVSDKAAVYTGGIHILLTDSANNPLSGGRFMIAHKASEKEQQDPAVTVELLDTGEETVAVVYDSFYGETLSGGKQDIAVTRADGTAAICGLAFGSYYLVQIDAPTGREPHGDPVKVKVDEVSYLTRKDGWQDSAGRTVDNTVCISNSGIVVPLTGGGGTAVYTASGSAVILSACLLLWFNRKKKIRL